MIYLIIINIIFIIWLFRKYMYIPKQLKETSKFDIRELDPALIGYIDDKDGNSIDWILAEILDLNRKDYIDIDYIREDINEYDYVMRKKEDVDISQLEKYELTAYRLLFDHTDEITINELEEKVKISQSKAEDSNIKGISIRNELESKLIELNIIDENSKNNLKLIKKLYIIITLIMIFMLKDRGIVQLAIFLIETIGVFYIFNQGVAFSETGKKLASEIKQYKRDLRNNTLLEERKIVHNILMEKEYINSIALHITSEARKEFIHDELQEVARKNAITSLGLIIYIIICIVIGFI